MMSDWQTGEAKQQFYEVLWRSETEPQQIFRNNRMVAAVISATTFEKFELWRKSTQRRTLGDAFDEVRELCVRHDYELDTGERLDRILDRPDPSGRR